jgi:hypothetical protein
LFLVGESLAGTVSLDVTGLSATNTEFEVAIELFRAIDEGVLGLGPWRKWCVGLSVSVVVIATTA